jgi:hypothetical protein
VRALLRVPRCSLVDVASCLLPVWLVLIVTHTAADADLWGHIRFGTDSIASGTLAVVDQYSFTADTPWINHEWLSEVTLAALYATGGAAGLNSLKLAVLAVIAYLTWRAGRLASGSRFALVALTSLVVFASYSRTQVLRPQLFSVLSFAVLLTLLDIRDRGPQKGGAKRAVMVGIPVLFGIWANLHGGWIVGFATLALWLGCDLLERRTFHSFISAALLILASLAATLVNPYGIQQWTFLHQTVGLSRDVSDWVPFLKLQPGMIAFELILPAVALVSVLMTRQWPRWRDAAVLGLLAFATYRVSRIDAFLQIAVGFFLAPAIVEALGRLERRLRAARRLNTRSPVHGFAVTVILIATSTLALPRLNRIYIEGAWMPDPEAVRFLRDRAPNSRLLTWFDWGEYAIWHLSPAGIRVSMDGRRETVYSERVLDDHWSFYKNDRNAGEYPDTIGADRIWLPRRLEVVSVLRERGWQVAFESNVSVVLSRDAGASYVPAAFESQPYFPGP